MPGGRGITIRVRKPAAHQADDEIPQSGSSLTSLDAPRNDDDDGDVTMDAADQPTPTAASSRPRRSRISRTKSMDFGGGDDAVLDSPSTRRSRRQSSQNAALKHVSQEEEEAPVERNKAPEPVQEEDEEDVAIPESGQGQVGADDDDDDEQYERGSDEGNHADDLPEDAEDDSRSGRSTPRGRPRGRGRGRGGRISLKVRGTRGAKAARGRGRPRQVASEDEGANSAADAQADDDKGEDDNDNDNENDNDQDSGDEDAGKGVDEEGFQTITIKGKTYRLIDDEVVLDSDPDGDKKVDEKGRLQGGRQYKAYNFTSQYRDDPERVYMLSIDAARSAGYRDSLYFFRKNPMIMKITLHQEEKDKLIEDGRLSGQLKSRNVTMVPARNVYKLHGARFLSGGKAVIDDYYEAAARASGAKEGKTVGGMSAEDQERKREADRDRDRSRRRPDAFTHTSFDAQGEPVVTVFGDAGQSPFVRAGTWASRRTMLQRAEVTEENWMLEMARSVRGMNSEIADTRRERTVAFPRFDDGLGSGEDAPVKDEEQIDGEADPEDDEAALWDRPPWEQEARAKDNSKTNEVLARLEAKRQAAEELAREAKKRRAPPLGIYEPTTHMPHFSINTQPRWALVEKVSSTARVFHNCFSGLFIDLMLSNRNRLRHVPNSSRTRAGTVQAHDRCSEATPPDRGHGALRAL